MGALYRELFSVDHQSESERERDQQKDGIHHREKMFSPDNHQITGEEECECRIHMKFQEMVALMSDLFFVPLIILERHQRIHLVNLKQ